MTNFHLYHELRAHPAKNLDLEQLSRPLSLQKEAKERNTSLPRLLEIFKIEKPSALNCLPCPL
jgi:hypothetical protein